MIEVKSFFSYFHMMKYIKSNILSRLSTFYVKRSIPTTSISARYYRKKKHEDDDPFFKDRQNAVFTVFGLAGFTYIILNKFFKSKFETSIVYANSAAAVRAPFQTAYKNAVQVGEPKPDLPYYTMDDVAKHTSKESGIWVTYRLGVYDITQFVDEHPGSDQIYLAAGGSVEPFWHIYQQHNNEKILSLLETLRIGNLNAEEQDDTSSLHDPWSREPKRHPVLKPASQRPFNAEPPPKLLVESYITPTDIFYVRNHLPVPDIDINTYELEIEVEINNKLKNKTKTLSVEELKKFPEHTITAAIMCGGNRRSEMSAVKEVRGLNWGSAAVGNATWTGVRLRDVLLAMGVESDDFSHVQFEGLDTDPTSTPYGASIPLSKVMDPRGDVLLAYKMNGETLSRDHGYPIRVITPGVVGARHVKWLGRIAVASEESKSHWQQNDYKGFSPSTDWDTVDFSKSPAIENMPVTSAICSPQSNETVAVDDGYITVRGYAWSGGGQKIVRVDVTGDGGQCWVVAELDQGKEPSSRHWGWTLWTAKVPVSSTNKQVEIWAKAVDSNYNVQPEDFKNTWNLRGVLSNAYHRVKVNIKTSS